MLDLQTYQEFRADSLVHLALTQLALDERLVHTRRTSFPVRRGARVQLDRWGELLLSDRNLGQRALLARVDERLIMALTVGHGHAEVGVAGADRPAVDALVARVAAELREDAEPDEEVAVTFWASSPTRFNPRRRIEAPEWSDIEDNYAAATRAQLEPLMVARRPGPGGLLLWHGPPGTGKTYALRALARAWRGWCDTHYISDPDAFLGGNATYLLGTLLRPPSGAEGEERWRLVVLEDSGELLAADARATTGQALSRLLNLSDGMLGAGLRTLVLVTTNEPLRKLHPAVVRPGRTWAEVDFAPLPRGEAVAWLQERGAVLPLDRPATIAELFALADGRAVRGGSTLGFAA